MLPVWLPVSCCMHLQGRVRRVVGDGEEAEGSSSGGTYVHRFAEGGGAAAAVEGTGTEPFHQRNVESVLHDLCHRRRRGGGRLAWMGRKGKRCLGLGAQCT
jgi:hypothetical protein